MVKLSKGGKSIASIPKAILYNKYLLYFVFAVALGNVVQLMNQRDHMSVVIMVVVGLLTSFFSKNMVVILCIALAVTNVLKYGTKIRVEGFKGDDDEEDNEEGDEEGGDDKAEGDEEGDEAEEEDEDTNIEKKVEEKIQKMMEEQE